MLAVLYTFFVYIRYLLYISLFVSHAVGEAIIVLLFYILNCTISTLQVTYSVLKVIYEDFGIFVLDILDKLNTTHLLILTAIENLFSLEATIKWVLNDCILSLFYSFGQFLDKIFSLLHNSLCAFKELLVLIGSGVWFAVTLIPFSLSFGLSLLLSIIKQFICDTCILAGESFIKMKVLFYYLIDFPAHVICGLVCFTCIIVSVHKLRRYLLTKLTKYLLTVWNKTVSKFKEIRRKKKVSEKLITEESENSCCVICREKLKCVVILPCKHLCLCKECTNAMHLFGRRCPICRTYVKTTMTVYV